MASAPHDAVSADGSEERARAQAVLERFRGDVSDRSLTLVGRLGDDACSPVAAQLGDGRPVVARFPFHLTLEAAVRVHQANFVLAHEMGAPELVLAAAKSVLPSSQPHLRVSEAIELAPAKALMVVEFAPAPFVGGHKTDRAALEAVPQATRVVAALLDFINLQMDRLPQNALFDGTGKVLLIDEDFTHGHIHPHGGTASIFFPGGAVGYDGATQQSLSDLPAPCQRLVQRLCDMSLAAVQEEYGLDELEATVLQARAARVVAVGLTQAICEAATLPPTLLLDGTIVKEPSSAAIYVMRGGTRWHIPDPETMRRLGFRGDQVKLVPDGSLVGVGRRVSL
jgi:hypothetical protein